MKVGFVGWRGMVGSVLLERMQQERDFDGMDPTFFSTSNVGGTAPSFTGSRSPLLDAYDLEALGEMEVLVSCQGGDYTQKVYQPLRSSGWNGFWIDAASTLRMDDRSIIVLDPLNRPALDTFIASGGRTFVGGNCTVSLMLLALAGLFREGLVEWVSTMTYQAASGAGAAVMEELLAQGRVLSDVSGDTALEKAQALTAALRSDEVPHDAIGYSLAYNLLPYIDKEVEGGQSREEWKGGAEAARILGETLPIDGLCVRVGVLRCHSQALTVKLRRPVPLPEIEHLIASAHEWIKVVPNTREDTLRDLTPAAVTGSLTIAIGRLRKMKLGEEFLTAFTIGDQLLWGAAEPLRRTLAIIRESRALLASRELGASPSPTPVY